MTQVATTNKAVNLFAAFATDEQLEVAGVETQIEGAGDTKFLVARWQNDAFNKMFAKQYERNKVALKAKGPEAEAKSAQLWIDVMNQTILLGWEGSIIVEQGGSPVPYSKEAGAKLLRLKGFRAAVQTAAEDISKFKIVQDEEDLGN